LSLRWRELAARAYYQVELVARAYYQVEPVAPASEGNYSVCKT